VTSAGIARFEWFADITNESWDQTMAVNVTGTFNCIQETVNDMRAQEWGRIVMISSAGAQRGAPRMAHYVASKGAVIALSKALALELARFRITVNNIAPGSIDTPMAEKGRANGFTADVETMNRLIPVGRMGTGDDIAAAVMYLCSDAAGFVTGQTIGVNGGVHLSS
jgi:2-hydroxycyclohexanecarboxyl-CoA dehydrogenase